MDQYPDGIYNSPDKRIRDQYEAYELEQLDQEDANGHPINIYSNDGYPIQRRIALFQPDTKNMGVLIDFQNIDELFLSEDPNFVTGGHHRTDYTVYPQAGLRTAGHFQAKGLIQPCYKLLQGINDALMGSDDNSVSGSSQDDHGDNTDSPEPAVFGISSQGYNAVMHNTRGRSAQHHEVQVGYITRMLAASWMNTKAHQRDAQKWIRKCEQALPHQAYAEKIRDRSICRDLRLENVYYVDLDALKPHQKKGR